MFELDHGDKVNADEERVCSSFYHYLMTLGLERRQQNDHYR